LYLGLVSGLVVVIVSLSGALYVFEEEGRELLQHRYFHIGDAAGERLSLQQLTDTVKAHYPQEKINLIWFKEKKDAAFQFRTKSNKTISIDPYTGKEIGMRDGRTDFFSKVLDVHKTLLLGKTGKEIVRWNVLIFFVMCISGLVLWWPRQKRFWAKALRIKFKTRNWKRLNWDLHSVLGFYAVLVLALIAFTGMFFVFDSVKDMVRLATGQPRAAKEVRKEMVRRVTSNTRPAWIPDSAYQYMIRRYPGAEESNILFPADSLAPLQVILRYDYAFFRKQNTLLADPCTGKRMKEELYKDYTAYDKFARTNFDLHTGRIRALGLGSKMVYFLASLVAASLPVTGFLIWLGRKKKR